MKRLTSKELDAIRNRAEKATDNYWYHSEGIYVLTNITGDLYEWDGDVVAECEKEDDAEFIAHAREDIPKLMSELEFYRGIVFDLGNTIEQWDCDEPMDKADYVSAVIDIERKCQKIVEEERKSLGLLFCEECFEWYRPETSISNQLCASCQDKVEMEVNEWDELDDYAYIDYYYEEDDEE